MEKPKYIDFHTHTFYSDGLGTPEDNVRIARLNGIDYMAITDHDNLNGIARAQAEERKWGIGVIAGVEISTDKYHILGLGIDPQNLGFLEFIADSGVEQRKVCEARIQVLSEKGVPITLEKVLRKFPDSRLGKINIMYTMAEDMECQNYVRQHYGSSITLEMYKKMLKNENGREIVDKDNSVTPREAIMQIHRAGGRAFIAHPYFQIKDTRQEGRFLWNEMDELRWHGLDGIEVQPQDQEKNNPFRQYATDNNLLITYGSDWHGGIFDRTMLTQKGENVLDAKLAEALRIV
jgi:3',5'-nucleoside bisphosphate phosphatase